MATVPPSFRARVLYQKPGGMTVLRSILAVPRTALFWTEISDVVPKIYWSHSPSLGVKVSQDAQITTDTTVALTFHIFSLGIFQMSRLPSS